VYDSDPMQNPAARRFTHLTYNQVIDQRLRVMDVSAVDMCQRNHVPLIVFDLSVTGNMRRAVLGESIGTLIDAGPA
jgi:uridylate kinase